MGVVGWNTEECFLHCRPGWAEQQWSGDSCCSYALICASEERMGASYSALTVHSEWRRASHTPLHPHSPDLRWRWMQLISAIVRDPKLPWRLGPRSCSAVPHQGVTGVGM
ncbi:hypothetical protein MHYP_G00057950 [Metynnis hypsauchen]